MLYVDETGRFYGGDMCPGDRPATSEELAAYEAAQFSAMVNSKQNAVRDARRPVFFTLAGMQSEALTKGDADTAAAIVELQQALRDLPGIDLSTCTTAEQIDAAFTHAWLDIAALAPEQVRNAFNEVLA